MARIGYVGLGVMGGGVARRLLEAGHDVIGYNRTRQKADALIADGMRFAETPRAAAERSDVVFSMVTNTKALEAVTEGPDGILAGLGPGKVYIDMSTVSPAASRALAERVGSAGAEMLDGPVSGSVISLEQGRLSVIVGGDEATFERVAPILRDIGPTVTHVGGNGQAVLMKVATNLSLAVQMLAFCEGVLLAEKGGISREDAVQVLTNSAIASPMVQYRGPFVLEHAGRGLVRLQHDAEGHGARPRPRPRARRPPADAPRSRISCSRPRAAWVSHTTTSPSCSTCWRRCPGWPRRTR